MSTEFFFVYRRTVPEGIPAYLRHQDGSQAVAWVSTANEAERISPNKVVEFIEDTSKLRREFYGKLLFVQADVVPAREVFAQIERQAAEHQKTIENLRESLSAPNDFQRTPPRAALLLLESLTSARTDIKALQASLATEREKSRVSLELIDQIRDAWVGHFEQAQAYTAELLRQVQK